MKGRYYNPKLAMEDDKDGHWNNGIYTICNKSSVSPGRPKISFRESNDVVRYNQRQVMWEASIPHTWVRIKGQNSFKKLEKSSVMSPSTLAFLEETQKYIHQIRKPLNLKPSGNRSYRVLTPSKPRRPDLNISFLDRSRGKSAFENEKTLALTPTSELLTEGDRLMSISPDRKLFQPNFNPSNVNKNSNRRLRRIQDRRSKTRLERIHSKSPEKDDKEISLQGICMSPEREFNIQPVETPNGHTFETQTNTDYVRSPSKRSARVVISKKSPNLFE